MRIHVISPMEEKLYFARAGKHPNLHDLGRLMILQGMRPEEVTSLPKCDVNVERGRLQIRWGKSAAARRTLDLTSESTRILAARMPGDSSWIFPSDRNPGRHIARLNNAHDNLCKEAKKAGIEFNLVLYDFRHTFATRMAEAGIDLATLAAILGHSSIRIVQRYVQSDCRAQEERHAAIRRNIEGGGRELRTSTAEDQLTAQKFVRFLSAPRSNSSLFCPIQHERQRMKETSLR